MYNCRYVDKRLVFTYHAHDNKNGTRYDGKDRTRIPRYKIVQTIAKGQYGIAAHGSYKKTLKNIEVIYKVDDDGNFVVVTYYWVKPKRYINIVDRVLQKDKNFC
ncbi:hypothetical protein [Paraliobacillus ryukyuensis]|uniref:hypothetical protein n=1 Tax=Paraliobacillus ryukyuensis TaxID=200904 RepID=UPI0009A7D6FE|nr:hypothetical protein [Paraliobacillus ryukyuensis]